MGFYRVHMLEVISLEFLVVPLILLIGGFYTFFTALFGIYATMREDSCLVLLPKSCLNGGEEPVWLDSSNLRIFVDF